MLLVSERESLLTLPEGEVTLTRKTYFSEKDLALINAHRKPANRFGFSDLLGYLKTGNTGLLEKGMNCKTTLKTDSTIA
ncbi:DUF4158 domain-containing protein [Kosakonia sp. MUSA4]|uniref:DUF4158 domain-containing protein n=1 Tax=Kosakonia sp. MUSA4 TaxID=2067958 RepID=UPI0035304B32